MSPLAQASWITVVAICLIAVVLLAWGGYTGYSITVGAVGLAAAVNLLPPPGGRRPFGSTTDSTTDE